MSDPLNVYFQGRAAANHIVVSGMACLFLAFMTKLANPTRCPTLRPRDLHRELPRCDTLIIVTIALGADERNTTGRTQVGRLLHIGTHSIPLSIEALKFAIKLIKKGTDTKCYKLAVSVLQKVAPNDPDAKLDEEWTDRTNRRVALETEKMEVALKSYKHNLIKESIRV